MKNNTKSSITLPHQELKLVEELKKKIGAKSKVEVIRRGLLKLKETTDRQALALAYAKAAEATRQSTIEEVKELDVFSEEGLEKE